jgi:hypothetical protein
VREKIAVRHQSNSCSSIALLLGLERVCGGGRRKGKEKKRKIANSAQNYQADGNWEARSSYSPDFSSSV